MKTFWLSFRIENTTTGLLTPQHRRNALEKVVDDHGTFIWKDTTSFIIFDSDAEIGELAREIKRVVIPSKDIVLIRDMHDKSARVIGAVKEMDYLEMQMPYVVKV